MNNKNEQIEKIESAIDKILNTNEPVIYFFTYDTRGNARASVKYIYDMALTLYDNGFNAKILVEDETYSGIISWLDNEEYQKLPVVSIKVDKPEIKNYDILVVPEYYSYTLEKLTNLRATKVMLVQQKNYIFETLPIGSSWSDYGFDTCITTTESTKKYIKNFFPNCSTYVIPPIIGDTFSETDKNKKPFIAIHCRDRNDSKRIISEFYLKYPHLRWITFKDMNQIPYNEFGNNLKECLASVWIDNESTFGTFPLECMKCGVPVIGKIPDTEPEWLLENGFWTYDSNKIIDLLGTFVLAWLEGVELSDEVKDKMKNTLLPYDKEITKDLIIIVFKILQNNRLTAFKNTLEKLKKIEETV